MAQDIATIITHEINAKYIKNLSFPDFLKWSLEQLNVVDGIFYRKSLVDVVDFINTNCNNTLSFRQYLVAFSLCCKQPPVPIFNVISTYPSEIRLGYSILNTNIAIITWNYQAIEMLIARCCKESNCNIRTFESMLKKLAKMQQDIISVPMLFIAMGRPHTIKWLAAALSEEDNAVDDADRK